MNDAIDPNQAIGSELVRLDNVAVHETTIAFGVKEILEAFPEAVYTTDALGKITFYNTAAAKFWGTEPELGKSEFCGSWKLYWPDGQPMPHDECPMALALKERIANRGHEAIAERPDGTRVPFQAFPTPVLDPAGNLLGAMNILVDLTDRAAINEAALRYSAIVESSDDAILAKDINGTIISWNAGAQRIFGYSADEVIGRSILMLIPADRHDEETEILNRIHRGERVDHLETIRRRKDGSLVEISLTSSPMKDRFGRVIGASKIARDITERRRAEEQQHMLLREMDHRIKNLFALAGSIVTLSARFAHTPQELVAAVSKRLNALARAHNLTVPLSSTFTERTAQSTTLHDLIRTIVAPYTNSSSGEEFRCRIEGENIAIRGSAVTSIALLLHEFATNAAKYGAFSDPRGWIAIDCQVEGGNLVFHWKEHGGPSVAPVDEIGFGTLLEKATVSTQLGGEVVREWAPDGLSIRLIAGIDRLAGT